MNNLQFRLIFRGSQDNFYNFSYRYNGETPTFVIAKSNHNRVFGGYTDVQWNGTREERNGASFVYRIHQNKIKKCTHKYENEIVSHKSNYYYMICFPGAFWIKPDCNMKDQSEAGACEYVLSNFNNYDIPVKAGAGASTQQQITEFFTGAAKYRIKEVEVFHLAQEQKSPGKVEK